MITKRVAIILDVEIKEGDDPEALASALFDFLCDDPDDRFPAIQVVTGFGFRLA